MPRHDTSSEAIVRAAIAEMLRHGAAGLKVARVCKAAGVNQRMIYHHFASRRGLVATIMTGLLARTGRALPEDDPILETLRRELVLTDVSEAHVDLVRESAAASAAGRVLLGEYLHCAEAAPDRRSFAAWRALCWPDAADPKPMLRRSAVSRPARD